KFVNVAAFRRIGPEDDEIYLNIVVGIEQLIHHASDVGSFAARMRRDCARSKRRARSYFYRAVKAFDVAFFRVASHVIDRVGARRKFEDGDSHKCQWRWLSSSSCA